MVWPPSLLTTPSSSTPSPSLEVEEGTLETIFHLIWSAASMIQVNTSSSERWRCYRSAWILRRIPVRRRSYENLTPSLPPPHGGEVTKRQQPNLSSFFQRSTELVGQVAANSTAYCHRGNSVVEVVVDLPCLYAQGTTSVIYSRNCAHI